MRNAIALLAVVALAGTATAAPWVEVGDAGDLPAGAQPVVGSGLVNSISGSTDGGADIADYYLIDIKDPSTFSATTALNPGTLNDTTLYIMRLDGTGIAFNDDTSGANFLSTIPVGSPLITSLVPGQYLLLVTGFAVLPAWTATPAVLASLVFPFGGATFTGVNGPQNGNVHSTYLFAGPDANSFGSYTVDLTGASFVPTPGAAALLGLGGLVAARRRRA